MAMIYELWRLVEIADERRSTWELVDRFPSGRAAQRRIHELAGNNIVSPEGETYWYEDMEGTHTFRIEAVFEPKPNPSPN